MAIAKTALKILRTDLSLAIRKSVARAGRWLNEPVIALKQGVPKTRIPPSIAAGREIPEMIDAAELPFSAMIGVSLGMSLSEGRDIAQGLNENNPSGKFRVPTLPELQQLNEHFAAKLLGCNFSIWTETEDEADSCNFFVWPRIEGEADRKLFILCQRAESYRDEGSYYYNHSSFGQDRRYPLFAIRLIRDK